MYDAWVKAVRYTSYSILYTSQYDTQHKLVQPVYEFPKAILNLDLLWSKYSYRRCSLVCLVCMLRK